MAEEPSSLSPADPLACSGSIATAETAGVSVAGRDYGRRITFDRRPATKKASALVGYVIKKIEAWEKDEGQRKRSRSDVQAVALKDAVNGFLGGLALSVDGRTTYAAACPKSANEFSILSVGFRSFKAVYNAFLGLGLIEVERPGWRSRVESLEAEYKEDFGSDDIYVAEGSGVPPGQGMEERIRATQKLLELFRSHEIVRGSARRHFPAVGKPKPLILRGASTRVGGAKKTGRRLKIPTNDTTCRLREDVEELNNFIAGVQIEGAELTGWTRIFGQGDQEGFAWDQGGRLYARPADASYQSLSKEERGQIRLNGEAVVEIDITASHLSIAYALRDRSLAEHVRQYDDKGFWSELDPYGVAALPRAVVKAWVTITLSQGKPPSRWPQGTAKNLFEDQGLTLKLYKVKLIKEAMLEQHPILNDLEGIGWGKLQFIESKLIMNSMLKLKRISQIPALPVHDSLIVPRSAWWVTLRVLQDTFKEVVGQWPLRPKLSPRIEALPAPWSTPYWTQWSEAA